MTLGGTKQDGPSGRQDGCFMFFLLQFRQLLVGSEVLLVAVTTMVTWRFILTSMDESLAVQCPDRQEVEVLEFSRLLGGSGGVPWQKIVREGFIFYFIFWRS